MVDIWNKCIGTKHIHPVNEVAWRIVESQDITATRKLVDSYEDQIILEDMLESEKPPVGQEVLKYHPLLYTPFRYPPLKYGSRFAKKTEPSLWYGSLELITAMAEKAFYHLNFLRASEATYDVVQIPLTAFSANVKTEKGVKLHQSPFLKYSNIISSLDSYTKSQLLGSAMREANVHAFTYQSVRNINKGINIAVFNVSAFQYKNPDAQSFQSWQCIIANGDVVEFVRSSSINSETVIFPVDSFMKNGKLPFPAN